MFYYLDFGCVCDLEEDIFGIDDFVYGGVVFDDGVIDGV